MEENRNDIEILKAMIKENFEEQRKLIAKLETALEAVTSFNGKQMLDSRDMRLMNKPHVLAHIKALLSSERDRKSTRLNSSHPSSSRMPSSA